MRFWTIWTLPAMSIRERLRRTRDWLAVEFGDRLPQRVKYWVTMGEVAKATRTSKNIPATPLDEVLKNLETPKNGIA